MKIIIWQTPQTHNWTNVWSGEGDNTIQLQNLKYDLHHVRATIGYIKILEIITFGIYFPQTCDYAHTILYRVFSASFFLIFQIQLPQLMRVVQNVCSLIQLTITNADDMHSNWLSETNNNIFLQQNLRFVKSWNKSI